MIARVLDRITQQEQLNFLLTNRIPRRLLTRFVGWFSRIEQPAVKRVSLAAWQMFSGDLELDQAATSTFRSLHDCFTRELKPGARPIDSTAGTLVSPCDAIVGASGKIDGTTLIQAKGQPYTLEDLLGSPELVDRHRNGIYVTLRLTSAMYHRFHAPYACHLDEVTYISGDMWNVNPIALKRVARLFCKNERAVLPVELIGSGERLTLVPVAAILVASIHLNFLDVPLDMTYEGPRALACDATFSKGEEMGYFHHGSTIVVFGTPGLERSPQVVEGARIRVGEPLLRHRSGHP